MWYWQYELIVVDFDEEGGLATRCGVVAAKDIVSAVKELDSFYEIEEIKELQAITDTVFDFEDVQNEPNFRYKINKKIK